MINEKKSFEISLKYNFIISLISLIFGAWDILCRLHVLTTRMVTCYWQWNRELSKKNVGANLVLNILRRGMYDIRVFTELLIGLARVDKGMD